MKKIIIMFLLLGIQSIFADTIDPAYKDSTIGNIYNVLKMNGSLTIDSCAVKGGANKWEINVEKITLDGLTQSEININWSKLLEKEKTHMASNLQGIFPDIINSSTILNQNIIDQIKQANEGASFSLFMESSNDSESIRNWITNDLLTPAGKKNLDAPLNSSYRVKLDFFRYHFDEQDAEIIGEDLLVMKGVKEVIIIRIIYSEV